MNCGGLSASAPPRTRRRRFWTCSAAMSRRIVASESSRQLDQILHRRRRAFPGRRDRMIRWRSFFVHGSSPAPIINSASSDRAMSINFDQITSIVHAI